MTTLPDQKFESCYHPISSGTKQILKGNRFYRWGLLHNVNGTKRSYIHSRIRVFFIVDNGIYFSKYHSAP